MKKAYTITPAQYDANVKTMNDIEYRTGYSKATAHHRLLSGQTIEETTPKKTKDRYNKAYEENKGVKVPSNEFFFINEVLYNLWLNRDTDEPITAREMYAIVNTICEEIDAAESSASSAAYYANWDGHV